MRSDQRRWIELEESFKNIYSFMNKYVGLHSYRKISFCRLQYTVVNTFSTHDCISRCPDNYMYHTWICSKLSGLSIKKKNFCPSKGLGTEIVEKPHFCHGQKFEILQLLQLLTPCEFFDRVFCS